MKKYRSVTVARILDVQTSHPLPAMAQWAESLSKTLLNYELQILPGNTSSW